MEAIRLIIFAISFSPLFFTAMAHPDYHVCVEEKTCSPDGPAVRFPFRLLGKHPKYCVYNSTYNLQCDELNRTILHLPSSTSSSSAKVVVANLSYSSQKMTIQSSEACFGKQLRELDTPLTMSPFRYVFGGLFWNDSISVFNCSSAWGINVHYGGLDCLGTDDYFVNAIAASTILWGYAQAMQSCIKMHDISFIPMDLVYDFNGAKSLELSWSEPNCGRCEERGGICGWENQITDQIGCSGGNKPLSGLLKKLRISGPIIGCFLLFPAIGAIFFLYSKLEEQKENQQRIKTFLEDYATMKPTRYSYADLKKITDDFKYKLGEGAYGNVFKGRILNKIYVAVKLLHTATGNGEEYINEVAAIGRIHHVNVVRMLGFCADGHKRALVFEFLPNGSLDKFILPDGQQHHELGMGRLRNIAIGIARGIEYLHQHLCFKCWREMVIALVFHLILLHQITRRTLLVQVSSEIPSARHWQ